ncbi:MAG: BBP7 family outer membrane beta-barrel protein [Planctomycetia bacterium]|nr:BBP7 family outer membrane beta-barrel protein [Planctomycetia bacterium]
MSRTNITKILVSLTFVLTLATSASAQISQMRLFSPYPDDQFGGGRYMNEGFYGTIGAGIVSITQPTDQIVGSTKANTLSVYNAMPTSLTNVSVFTSTFVGNQINTSNIHSKWESATDFEVGRIQGHHGWSVKATIDTPHRQTMSGIGASVAIEDPEVMSIQTNNIQGTFYVWNQGASPMLTQVAPGSEIKVGRLWGLIGLNGTFSTTGTTDYEVDDQDTSGNNASGSTGDAYALVRIPITFKTYMIDTKINTWSVEAMYTYRFHPWRLGNLEFLAGVRYTTFDETFRFMGEASTKLVNDYTVTHVQVLSDGGTTISSGGNTTTDTNESYQEYDEDTSYSYGADFGASDWNFEAQNHIVGPQIGGRYTISNNRWRFIGESKFFAGFNRQNIYGYGNLGLNPSPDDTTNLTDLGGVASYTPIGTVSNSFQYSKHFNEFTPGIDTKVEAAWNWTEAVSFKVGYQMLYLDDLARAAAVNEYALNHDGTVFSVKENKDDRNFGTFVHGVMATVQVNR